MEMYADEEARGGVLEPEGIVGIKYRRDKQLETMARLDPVYGDLKRKSADKSLTQEQLSEIKTKMSEREQHLLPVYSQISIQFADLHDRAGRMEAKNVIRQSLRWREARRFFYWRVRRRLNEEYIIKKMTTTSKNPLASRARHLETLAAWTGIEGYRNADREVAIWCEKNSKTVLDNLEKMRQEAVAFDVAALLRSGGAAGLGGVKQVLGMMPAEEREEALKFLSSA